MIASQHAEEKEKILAENAGLRAMMGLEEANSPAVEEMRETEDGVNRALLISAVEEIKRLRTRVAVLEGPSRPGPGKRRLLHDAKRVLRLLPRREESHALRPLAVPDVVRRTVPPDHPPLHRSLPQGSLTATRMAAVQIRRPAGHGEV